MDTKTNSASASGKTGWGKNRKCHFIPEQIAEIESAYRKTTGGEAAHYLEILHLWVQGMTYEKICKQTGVRPSTVTSVVRKYQMGGLEAISAIHVNKYCFTPGQVQEIEAAYRQASDPYTARRLRVVYLRSHGEQLETVAEKTSCSRTTVIRLVRAYRDGGIEAILGRQPNPNKFSPQQTAELKAAYEAATGKRTRRRFKALVLLAEGKTIEETADEMGYGLTTVRQIRREYIEGGLAAIQPPPWDHPFIAHKYEFTAEQKMELRSARNTVTDKETAIRLEALWLRTEKKTLSEISAVTGFHQTSISAWIRTYQKRGLEAIIRYGSRDKRDKS